jgi:hypothetical protein
MSTTSTNSLEHLIRTKAIRENNDRLAQLIQPVYNELARCDWPTIVVGDTKVAATEALAAMQQYLQDKQANDVGNAAVRDFLHQVQSFAAEVDYLRSQVGQGVA